MQDFQLPVDNQGQRRGLHPSDGKHLTVLPVLHRIEPRGVHAQQPVTDGPAQSRLVERLEIRVVVQLGKALADGLFRQRRYPQTLHRAMRSRLLHHPPLDKFPFLPGIAAVDNHVRGLHQALDDAELLLVCGIVYQLDAKARGNHRQILQAPLLPVGCVFMRLLQRTKVPEGPRHLISVSLNVSVFLLPRPQHVGDIACHGGLLGNAYYHSVSVLAGQRYKKGL